MAIASKRNHVLYGLQVCSGDNVVNLAHLRAGRGDAHRRQDGNELIGEGAERLLRLPYVKH